MDTSRERDQSVERLLRQSLQTPRHAGVTDSCLDAETLAAWVDEGLSGAALEMAQSHVADCARCQSLVGAIARTNAAVSEPEPERATRRWLPWLVPLTAAAAAVALWVAVPRDAGAPVPRGADVEKEANQPQAPQAAASKVEREAPAELRKDTGRLEADSLKRDALSAPAAAPPNAADLEGPRRTVAEASAAKARSANAADLEGPRRTVAEGPGIEIVSPDPSVRWRIAGSVVERSTNGGSSWDAVATGVAAELTAGAAPSTSVCWLVGRGGVVLLSIDGRSWRRVVFPEITDLSAVRATDARTASVSTADGLIFSTSDGGATWDRQ